MVWYTQVALGGGNDVQETWLRLASPVVMSREESQGGPGARVMSACPGLLGKKWSCFSSYLVAKAVHAIPDISPFGGCRPVCVFSTVYWFVRGRMRLLTTVTSTS